MRKLTDSEAVTVTSLRTEEKHRMPDFFSKSPAAHSYLFGSDFVSVDALGKVLIMSLPSLSLKGLSPSKKIRATSTVLVNHWKQDSFHSKTSDRNSDELTMQAKAVEELTTSQTTCKGDGAVSISRFCKSDALLAKPLDGLEKIFESPVLRRNQLQQGDSNCEMLDVEIKEPVLLVDEDNDDLQDSELSPRLTNLIKSGVVPESPINESGQHPFLNKILYFLKVHSY